MPPLPRSLAWTPRLALLLTVGACAFFDPMGQAGLGVLLSPRDTTLYVGAQFQARGLMVNSYGDQYSSTHLRFAGLDSSASVDVGGTVTGLAYGRARIVVTRADIADTGWVSVVPTGTLAVSRNSNPSVVGIVNLDGSGFQSLAPAVPYDGSALAWLPGNAGLVYEAVAPGGGGIQLVVSDLAGHSRQLVPLGRAPRASRDGNWVYFQYPYRSGEIWRVHVDGSGPERITADTASYFGGDGDPDPSPDGTRVAFRRMHWPDDSGFQIDVRDLATGAERVLVAVGRLPLWSPSGDLIAFWKPEATWSHGVIFVVGADGTGAHQVSAAGRRYQAAGLDWSPDGQWLVARSDETLDLIQVATGLTLPLPYSGGFSRAGWRR